MRDGFRYSLLIVASIIAVLFVVVFTAWGLTTYGSVRHMVGDLAAQPDKAADLRDQYEEMTTRFASGDGSFTYYFRSAPITVARADVAGMSESEVISAVLDSYASGLYDNTLKSGGLGAASAFVGSIGNLLYVLAALLLAVVFSMLIAGAIMGFPDSSRPFKLKSAGKTIAAFFAVVFFVFALLPCLLKSLAWGSFSNGSAIRDILDVVEPMIVGSLLRNTLLVIVIAGILYFAGYWIETRGDPIAMLKGSRASAQRDHPHHENHDGGNRKRRSL